VDTIKKISLLSKQSGLNKSRLLEKSINEFRLEEDNLYISNSAGPIHLPINEIAIKVAKILKMK
jgi:hypothetical protein